MTNLKWKKSNFVDFTRIACHGFHYQYFKNKKKFIQKKSASVNFVVAAVINTI